MTPFTRHRGVCAVIDANNVDTDQIIPSREMRTVSKSGLGDGLFAGWRYTYEGNVKTGRASDFILNQAPFDRATILLSGKNFGCGSSREHAVWALRDFGIRAVIAESFGRIFRGNCARNGVLAIEITPADAEALKRSLSAGSPHVEIDLESCRLSGPGGDVVRFEVPASDRGMLLAGLDAIDLALRHVDAIDRFRAQYHSQRPFAKLPRDA